MKQKEKNKRRPSINKPYIILFGKKKKQLKFKLYVYNKYYIKK